MKISGIPRAGSRAARLVAPLIALTCIVLPFGPASAQETSPEVVTEVVVPPPAPPTSVAAIDAPNDAGHALLVTWQASPDDANADVLAGYRVLRSQGGSPFEEVGVAAPGQDSFRDRVPENAVRYDYKVVSFGPGGVGESGTAGAEARFQWFDKTRVSSFVIMLIVCGAIVFNILRAQAGQKMYIRKIAGMDAVTEAVGRATEMGQPVLYVAGIQDMDNVQTVAGLTILGSISKLIAEYETSLVMPCSRSLVMSTARETVKESYLSAGRPDAYREDGIYYVTDEQFGFVAHVDGLMVRKKPATCFYLGAFFAESLILAETGNSIGAIQVAGTAMPTQLPFFVAACDYTLIGEELFAASAYLSQDEKMLGSLKGQDFGKGVAMVSIFVGGILTTIEGLTGWPVITMLNDKIHWLWSGG
ncbi:MAG: hypothetical protein KC591_04010 [Gemmatimonadetes bacterium]|nr:hypothetical protein [Gemmatimonadota bacterium]